jgi:regulator of sirC expression with transglutaminase-like and TPR domain
MRSNPISKDSPYRSLYEAVECPDSEINLGRASLAIVQAEYPGLDVDGYVSRLDRLAVAVKDLAGVERSTYRFMACINYVLFKQEAFQGNRSNYYDPRNSFLNEVLDRRTGIPITLCVLYMEVARRVGLTLEGVGFPGHFLVKCINEGEEFVVDPFHGGEVRSIQELQGFLDQNYRGRVTFRPEFLMPVSKRQILKRILNNLKTIYLHRQDLGGCLSVIERLVILEPDSAQEIRDRGIIYLKLGEYPQALEDLEAYLHLSYDAEDADVIRTHVASLRKRVMQLH